MIKSDHWIHEFCSGGGVTPYIPAHVNPASLDVTLSNSFINMHGLDLVTDTVKLYPREILLASTNEYIRMPQDVAGDLKLKSSLGRQWLNHSLSGWIDPSFEGQVTLELQNIGIKPIILKAGMRIAQIIFMQLDRAPSTSYADVGHYNKQMGATRAWSEQKNSSYTFLTK